MFTQLTPQKVQHSSGYIVQVANRESVEYLDSQCKAIVDVDFASTIEVYANTLRTRHILGAQPQLSPSERKETIDRIVAGLEAMGSKVEVY